MTWAHEQIMDLKKRVEELERRLSLIPIKHENYLHDFPINDLEISTRTRNILIKNGITKVGQLYTEDWPHLGRKSKNELLDTIYDDT